MGAGNPGSQMHFNNIKRGIFEPVLKKVWNILLIYWPTEPIPKGLAEDLSLTHYAHYARVCRMPIRRVRSIAEIK